MITCTVLGVEYVAQPTTQAEDDACLGCAGIDDVVLCDSLDSCCGKYEIIWIKQEQPS